MVGFLQVVDCSVWHMLVLRSHSFDSSLVLRVCWSKRDRFDIEITQNAVIVRVRFVDEDDFFATTSLLSRFARFGTELLPRYIIVDF